ncbi:MAG TPA: glycogen debranching enzyme, partial [Chromatiales bacterium]|nr:glycogen debranching enzyme [Chromatiales bacterium]
MSTSFGTRFGRGFPPGASVFPDGVNFSIFSRHATAVWLNLYRSADAHRPFRVIELDPAHNRTFYFWHVFVEGAGPGVYYTWKLDGPDDTSRSGLRFDPRHELLDPWARCVSDLIWDRSRAASQQPGNTAIRAVVVDDGGYDWEDDAPV